MPRRRRGGRAGAVDREPERGLAMRIFLHSPKDMIAGALAFAAVSAIIANALFLQAGRHPSPMFGSVVALPATGSVPASPLPRPRPVDAMIRSADDPKPAEPKAADAMANLVKSTGAPVVAPSNIGRPETTANPAASPRRVAAVQRAATRIRYRQPRTTRTVGSHTPAAVPEI